MARGKLIVFEGLDRAGKTTQCQMLVDALREEGQDVLFMRFPGTQMLVRGCYLPGDGCVALADLMKIERPRLGR